MDRCANNIEWSRIIDVACRLGSEADHVDLSGEWADRPTRWDVLRTIRTIAETPHDVVIEPEEEEDILDAYTAAWYEVNDDDDGGRP